MRRPTPQRAGGRPPVGKESLGHERSGTHSTTRGCFVMTTSSSSTMTKEYLLLDKDSNVRSVVVHFPETSRVINSASRLA